MLPVHCCRAFRGEGWVILRLHILTFAERSSSFIVHSGTSLSTEASQKACRGAHAGALAFFSLLCLFALPNSLLGNIWVPFVIKKEALTEMGVPSPESVWVPSAGCWCCCFLLMPSWAGSATTLLHPPVVLSCATLGCLSHSRRSRPVMEEACGCWDTLVPEWHTFVSWLEFLLGQWSPQGCCKGGPWCACELEGLALQVIREHGKWNLN